MKPKKFRILPDKLMEENIEQNATVANCLSHQGISKAHYKSSTQKRCPFHTSN
jgi:hypothetical protein